MKVLVNIINEFINTEVKEQKTDGEILWTQKYS